MVLTYRTGAAGGGGKGMAEYLGAEADVPELAAKLSAYLSSSMAPAEPGMTAAIPKRDMHPLIADLLNIDPNRSLSTKEMANLLAGHRTDGKAIEGKRTFTASKEKTRLAYTDFTFSAPKSFSIALVMAPTDAERAILEECWIKANYALMDHIASKIGVIRDKEANVVDHGHVAIIRYDHYTSRPTVKLAAADGDTTLMTVPSHIPGDMQRHTHNIIPNVCITDEGKVRALPLDEMRDQLHEWGAIGHAYLSRYLQEHGIRVGIDPKTGLSQLDDVPRRVCELYQSRHNDGEAAARKYAAEQGEDWDSLDPKAKVRILTNRMAATRRAKDGKADYAAWLQTAEKAGYRHRSVLRPDDKKPRLEKGEQIKAAYTASLPLLEAEWTRRAKLEGSVPRIMAARGLIVPGIETPRDVDLVTAAYRTEGVRQNGRMTPIVWSKEDGKRFASVTTALHEDQEREAIGLLKAAAADKTASLSVGEISAALDRVAKARGYDFTTDHGRQQAAMATAFATGGRAIVGVGSAGSGKTATLEPVIDAYHAAGWNSYGVTLAWRQTHALSDAGVGQGKKPFRMMPDTDRLTDAGIGQDRAFALAAFLKRAAAGEIELTPKTLVVIDEIATIGTRDILSLARLQGEHGFKIVGMGDDKQCTSIAAGNTIKLFRHALGSNQVPEILDTIRQKRIEDRETAKLFRSGKPEETRQALDRKDNAGLLTMTPGGYTDAIKAGVDEWERRTAANENRENYRIGISVPTNADAHAVGLEIRQRLRAAGKVTGSDFGIEAQDQNRNPYPMDIAIGDTVRLFNRVNARYGERSRGYFGENGTTAQVVAIKPDEGLSLKRADGATGFIKWASLQDKDTGRVKLAYGTALTIDTRQGDTLTDHITILPGGSKAINAFKMYPADTRNREDSVLVVSHGAEKEEVRNRRPLGDPWLASASDDEMRSAIRGNMARNLSRQPEKSLATDMIDAGMEVFRGSINGMQAAWHRTTQAAEQNREPDLSGKFQESKDTASLVSLIDAIKRSSIATNDAVKLLTHEEKPQPDNRAERRRQAALDRKKAKRPMRQERTINAADARAEFADALRREGFQLTGEPVMDGKWHRERVEGDKGATKTGSYRAFVDGWPNGHIHNFKTGDKPIRWVSERQKVEITPQDRRKWAAEREERAQKRTAGETKAAERAVSKWESGYMPHRHKYLAAKQITAGDTFRQDRQGNLMTAMRDEAGKIWNVQTITPAGEKKFLYQGRINGLFSVIGTVEPNKPILIAEGPATAKTIHDITGMPVAVAYNAGNLAPAARAIAKLSPTSQQVFMADNDHHLPRKEMPLANVGKEKAEAAAKEVGGIVLLPAFAETDRGTDFNDLAAMIGKEKLRTIIGAKLKEQGITMPERKAETVARRDTVSQAERDRAWQNRQTSQPMEQAQREARHAEQESARRHEKQRHNRGPSL